MLITLRQQSARQQPVRARVILQLVEQRHFRLQLAVKGGQHRQAAVRQALGMIGNGEKLKERIGGAQVAHAGDLIKPLHTHPLACSVSALQSAW